MPTRILICWFLWWRLISQGTLSGAEVKLLSLTPFGAQKMQGCAKCILLAGFPCLLLEIFIEVPQKVGGELSEQYSLDCWSNMYALSQNVPWWPCQNHNKARLSVPMWHFLRFCIVLLRLQSLDSNHCQRIFLENKRKYEHPTPTSKLFHLLWAPYAYRGVPSAISVISMSN